MHVRPQEVVFWILLGAHALMHTLYGGAWRAAFGAADGARAVMGRGSEERSVMFESDVLYTSAADVGYTTYPTPVAGAANEASSMAATSAHPNAS